LHRCNKLHRLCNTIDKQARPAWSIVFAPQARLGAVRTLHGATSIAVAREGEPAMPPGRPVLLINDDAHLRRALGRRLRDSGFRVAGAADGLAGLRSLQRRAACWVLLDLDMPVMSGYEFLTALRRLPFPPRAFVVSDVVGAGATERARRLGAERCFSAAEALQPGFSSTLRSAIGLPALGCPRSALHKKKRTGQDPSVSHAGFCESGAEESRTPDL